MGVPQSNTTAYPLHKEEEATSSSEDTKHEKSLAEKSAANNIVLNYSLNCQISQNILKIIHVFSKSHLSYNIILLETF